MSDMSFASLSPTLLARKGGAKPAMRRQSIAVAGARAHQPGTSDNALDDLGWNDLGETADNHAADNGTAQAAPHASASNANDIGDAPQDADFAPLTNHAQSTATEEADVEAQPKVTPIRKGAPRLPRPALAISNPREPQVDKSQERSPTGRRTAFTLRLDTDRHLKLRMAATLAGRSAQAIVTDAVDAMFAEIPELDPLVARVQSRPQQEG